MKRHSTQTQLFTTSVALLLGGAMLPLCSGVALAGFATVGTGSWGLEPSSNNSSRHHRTYTYPATGTTSGTINNSVLINPTVINSTVVNSTLIDPTIVNPYPANGTRVINSVLVNPTIVPSTVIITSPAVVTTGNSVPLTEDSVTPAASVLLQSYQLYGYRYYRQPGTNAFYLQVNPQGWSQLNQTQRSQLVQNLSLNFGPQGASLVVESYERSPLGQYLCSSPMVCRSLSY